MFQCGVKENGLPRRCAPRDGGIPRFIDLPPSPFRGNDMVILGPARRFLRLMQGAGLFSPSWLPRQREPTWLQADSKICLLLEEKVSSKARRMRCAAGNLQFDKSILRHDFVVPPPSRREANL